MPVSAQLIPTQFGFPSIFQHGETTAFSRDTADAFSYEAANINFGGGVPFVGTALAFPSISQVSVQSQSMTSTDYYHTEETTAFGYPYVGIGGTPLPVF